MIPETKSSPVLRAIEALNHFDRHEAVALLRKELDTGGDVGKHWQSVARLAGRIGEIGIEREAMRRFAQTPPVMLEHILAYCETLAKYGGVDDAFLITSALSEEAQTHISTLHFLGVLAAQIGRFDQAEMLFRHVLSQAPYSARTWYALSVIKKFTPDDPDLRDMVAYRAHIAERTPDALGQYLFGLGKAYDDAGEPGKAALAYLEGARLERTREPFDMAAHTAFTRSLIENYTAANLARLTPSGCDGERVIFVNGLPRSGTTLVEQILTGHSAVADGGEVNLLNAALIPAGDLTLEAAMAYQARDPYRADPWGELARDYLKMIDERFGAQGQIVDKTLNQSRLMGLLLHSLPKARVIWLRRSPEDCALSCFRTYFASPVPWAWSLSDIAAYFRNEDALYEHWSGLYPDRILTVPYEALVTDPETWIRKILSHVGLAEEPQVFEPHKQSRSVMTASVAQVREPISQARIGAANAYKSIMEAFTKAYYGA